MIRSVILVESGFQDEEFVYPYYRMLEEGWQVDVASPDGAERKGKYGVPARVNRMIGNLDAKDYDAVVIPGGFECPDRLRTNDYACRFVRDMWFFGKLVAAICHGPWVLINAGIIAGRVVTGYDSITIDLGNAGGRLSLDPVVVDANLITANHYKNNGSFMRAVTLWMAHKYAVAHV